MYQFAPPTSSRLEYIHSNLRAADVLEADLLGLDTSSSIFRGASVSKACEVILLEDEPVGVWGATESGIAWAVGTPRLTKYPKAFFEQSKDKLKDAFKVSPTLRNYVHSGNTRAVRWLEHLGAEFGPDRIIGGATFRPFLLIRK